MIYNILAVGDVVGACGVKHLSRCLRSLKKRKSIHFTVVNGENAAMVGLTPNDAEEAACRDAAMRSTTAARRASR